MNYHHLQSEFGINFMGENPVVVNPNKSLRMAMDAAQPTLVTQPNSAILAFLNTNLDPNLIRVLLSPMKAVDITGVEAQKGNWLTATETFIFVESTGLTTAYGDYNNSGNAGTNVNFPQRQSFHYQVVTQWGEKELETMGLAKLDWAAQQNIASVITLNKFQNKSYFYGIDGLQNYGLLNDPDLSAPILPTTKTAGGTTWAVATADEILADIRKLFTKLQSQANGTVALDTPMTLALSPLSESEMQRVSAFNVGIMAQIKTIYPNLKIVSAPEYSTLSGELVQLIADELDGQRTAICAFTEKLRAHPIILELSSFQQKKSQGTWGTIIFRPFAIAQMLGV
jgi:hypothetical protein